MKPHHLLTQVPAQFHSLARIPNSFYLECLWSTLECTPPLLVMLGQSTLDLIPPLLVIFRVQWDKQAYHRGCPNLLCHKHNLWYLIWLHTLAVSISFIFLHLHIKFSCHTACIKTLPNYKTPLFSRSRNKVVKYFFIRVWEII